MGLWLLGTCFKDKHRCLVELAEGCFQPLQWAGGDWLREGLLGLAALNLLAVWKLLVFGFPDKPGLVRSKQFEKPFCCF